MPHRNRDLLPEWQPAAQLFKGQTISSWLYKEPEVFILTRYAGTSSSAEFRKAHGVVLDAVEEHKAFRLVWDQVQMIIYPEDAAWARGPWQTELISRMQAMAEPEQVVFSRAAFVLPTNPFGEYIIEMNAQEMEEAFQGRVRAHVFKALGPALDWAVQPLDA